MQLYSVDIKKQTNGSEYCFSIFIEMNMLISWVEFVKYNPWCIMHRSLSPNSCVYRDTRKDDFHLASPISKSISCMIHIERCFKLFPAWVQLTHHDPTRSPASSPKSAVRPMARTRVSADLAGSQHAYNPHFPRTSGHWAAIMRVCLYKFKVEPTNRCLVRKTNGVRSYKMSSPWCRFILSLAIFKMIVAVEVLYNWLY